MLLLLSHVGVVHLARLSLLLLLIGRDTLLHLHRTLLLLLLVECGLLLCVLLLKLLLLSGALLLLHLLNLLRILILLSILALGNLRPLLLLLHHGRLLLLDSLMALELLIGLLLRHVAKLTRIRRPLLTVSGGSLNWRQRQILVRLLFLSRRLLLLLLQHHLVYHLLLLRVLASDLLVGGGRLVLLHLHRLLRVAILSLNLLLAWEGDARLLQLGRDIVTVRHEQVAIVCRVVTRIHGDGQAHFRRDDQVVVVLHAHLGETLGLARHGLLALNVDVHLLFLDEFSQLGILDVGQDDELQNFEPLIRANLDLEGLVQLVVEVWRLDRDVQVERPRFLLAVMAGLLLAGLVHVAVTLIHHKLLVELLLFLLWRLGYDLGLLLDVSHLRGS